MSDLESILPQISNFSVIAVTGKMAAGKNFICSQLENEGWASVDADSLVHKAINIAQTQILTTFQPYAQEQNIQITNSDGSINRRALGELLFSTPSLLKTQESIVYPIITKMIDDFIVEHPKTIINATVLYKTPEILNRCQTVLFVTAPFLTRLSRAHKRDHLPFKQILKRFHSQRHLLKQYKNSPIPVIILKNS